jgi:hypothetical protein
MVASIGGITAGSLDPTEVRGRVTYNGRPVSNADIVFHSSDKLAKDFASTRIAEDGSFSVWLFRGRYEIFLIPFSLDPRGRPGGPPRPDEQATPGALASPRLKQFPARFRDPRTSQLSVAIGGRVYRIDIDLRTGAVIQVVPVSDFSLVRRRTMT